MLSRHDASDYITRTFVQEPAWLASIRTHGESIRPGLQISPYEARLLQFLLQASGAQEILEIGTFVGYSTLWMAQVLSQQGHIITLERTKEYAKNAAQHFSDSDYADQITLHEGDGLAWLEQQPQEPRFEFVFIDAEKRYYPRYLELVLPLLKPRAWIIGDNSLLFGALTGKTEGRASPEAIAAMQTFNTTLADQTRFESILLPTAEGMTVARLKA